MFNWIQRALLTASGTPAHPVPAHRGVAADTAAWGRHPAAVPTLLAVANLVAFGYVVTSVPGGLPTWSLAVMYIVALASTEFFAASYRVGEYQWTVSFSPTVYVVAGVLAPGAWMIWAAAPAFAFAAVLRGSRTSREVIAATVSRLGAVALGVYTAHLVTAYLAVHTGRLTPDQAWSWTGDALPWSGFGPTLAGAFVGIAVWGACRSATIRLWRPGSGPHLVPTLDGQAESVSLALLQVAGAAAIGRVLREEPALLVPLLAPLALAGGMLNRWMHRMHMAALASALAQSRMDVHGRSLTDACHVLMHALRRLGPHGTLVQSVVIDPDARCYELADGPVVYTGGTARAQAWGWATDLMDGKVDHTRPTVNRTTDGAEVLFSLQSAGSWPVYLRVHCAGICPTEIRSLVRTSTALLDVVAQGLPEDQRTHRVGEKSVLDSCAHLSTLVVRDGTLDTREVLRALHRVERSVAAVLGQRSLDDEESESPTVGFVSAGEWDRGHTPE